MELEFKKEYLKHEVISVRAAGQYYPVKREIIHKQAMSGAMDDKRLRSFFTKESVEQFIAERKKKEDQKESVEEEKPRKASRTTKKNKESNSTSADK